VTNFQILADYHRGLSAISTEAEVKRAHELAALRYEAMAGMATGERLAKTNPAQEQERRAAR
jgi:hypothetical protein